MREQERSRERFCFRLEFTHPNSLRISAPDARKDTRPLRIPKKSGLSRDKRLGGCGWFVNQVNQPPDSSQKEGEEQHQQG